MPSHTPYPAYRPTDLPWLGQIPAHWDTRRIKFLCSVSRGASPRPIDDTKYFDDNGEYSWVRISDVTASEKYLLNTEQRLSDLGKSKSVPLEPGELFVSIAASVGKPIITGIKCCIHDGFVWLKGLKQDREYFYYLLLSDRIYAGLGKTGTQLNLNSTFIGDIEVPLPPLPEQRTIAAYLDHQTAKIDALIAKKRRLLDLLTEQRAALISRAVTQGLNPAVEMKDSGVAWLGQVPGHWEVDLVKRNFDIDLGKMLDSSKQPENGFLKPYLRAANIYWDGVWLGDVNEMKFTKEQLKRYRLQKGDLLVTEGGVTVGRSAIYQGEMEEVYYQNSINRARPKGTLPVKFLYYWLYALKLTGFIDNVVSKATFGHLTKDKLELLQMTVPPQQEAEQITKHLDTKLLHIARTEEKIKDVIERLREYRAALISSVVTGKIQIREAA